MWTRSSPASSVSRRSIAGNRTVTVFGYHQLAAGRTPEPEVTLRLRCPGVADRAPRAALGIDHQLGAQAEPPPSARRTGHAKPMAGAKFPREVPEAIGAGLRHEQGNPAEPGRWGSRRRPPAPHQRASADEARHQSSRTT